MPQSGAGELEVASVLFMDLVGYSRHQMEVQRELLGKLEKAVSESPAITCASAGADLIRIPTGDGMALVFFHDPTDAAQSAVEIGKAARSAGLELRIGLHAGPVYRINDINDNRNVSGGGINFAQRVMDCGDAGHILVSGTMAEMLNQVGNWAERLHDLGELEVKHGVRLRLFNLTGDDVGNPSLPKRIRQFDSGLSLLGEIRTRVSAKRGVAAFAIAGLIVLTAGTATLWRYARPSVRPSAEALTWYRQGLAAIRDGTYLSATKALERAASLSPGAPLIQARLAEAWNELDSPQRAGEAMLRIASGASESLGHRDALTVQAVHKTIINDYSGAVTDLEEAVRLADRAEKPFAFVDLGRGLEKASNPKKALECYTQAARLAPNYAGALIRQAILQARFQDRGAAASFDAAAGIYEASSNLEGVTEVLLRRGEIAIAQKNSEQAGQFLERALQLAQTAANPSQQVQVLLKLSVVAYNSGALALSEQRASDAIQLSRSSGVDNLTARAIIDLGSALFVRGEFTRAQRYFEEGLAVAHRYQNKRAEAAALYSLGNLEIRLHHSESGAKQVEQALAFYKANGFNREASQCLVLLGRFERDQGRYQRAIDIFQEQLRLGESLADKALTTSAHESLGSVLLRQERFPEALVHLRHNYDAQRAMNDPIRLAYASLQEAEALWQLGHYAEAGQLADSVALLAEQEAYRNLASNVFQLRAQMALSKGAYAQAIALARKSNSPRRSYPGDDAEMNRVECLALARSGAAASGMRLCERAAELGNGESDPKIVALLQMALIEARLKAGDTRLLAADVERVVAVLERLGCLESSWRALLLVAEVTEKANDSAGGNKFRVRARETVSKIKNSWGTDIFSIYSRRPDVIKALRDLRN